MMNKNTFLSLIFFLAVPQAAQTVLAAPAMESPECTLKGLVVKQEKRVEEYTNESWRKDWGLPKEHVYQDISIQVLENDYASEEDRDMAAQMPPPEDCDKQGNLTVYQLRDDASFFGLFGNPKLLEKCITAKSKNSGDEFSYGNWLYDITILSDEDCHEDAP